MGQILRRFISFEYPKSVYLAFLLVLAIGLLSYSTWYRLQITCESVCTEASRLNSEERYAESIGLLLFYVEKFKDNEPIIALLQDTFPFYIADEIKQGYALIGSNPKVPEGYLKAASGFALAKDFFRAMEVLTVGIIEVPDSADLWMNIGILELKLKRDAEALSAFVKVTELDNQNAQAFNQAAFLQSRSQDARLLDFEGAKKDALTALRLDPKNADYWETLSEIHFRLGESTKAQAAIKEAQKLSPHEKYYQIQENRYQTTEPQTLTPTPQSIAK